MKFEKPPSSTHSGLTDEQIVLSERFKERRMREEESRRREVVNPYMQARIAQMFRQLLTDLDARPDPSPRWRPAEARLLTPEELQGVYGTKVMLSAAALETLKPKEEF